MADWQTIDQIINDADMAALAWYSAINNRPVAAPGATPDQVRAQVLATASTQAPATALWVSNPLALAAVAAVLVLLVFVFKD